MVAVAALAAARLATAAPAPLPAAGAVDGWAPDGAPKVFNGAELYGYIDGGSEIFLELGFDRLVIQDYARGDDVMSVEAYRMTDTAGARAIYGAKCGRETPSGDVPARNTAGRYQLALQKGPYYVVVNNPAGAESLIPDMAALGRSVAEAIPQEAPVAGFAALPRQGLVEGTESVIRGPYGLQPVITLGDGDILSLGGERTAVSADYVDGGVTTTLIQCDYEDAADARAAFVHLADNLDPYLDLVDRSDDRLVFRDYAGRWGVASLTGARMAIRVNLPEPPDPVNGDG